MRVIVFLQLRILALHVHTCIVKQNENLSFDSVNFSYTCLVKKFDVILHKEINRNNTLMFALSRAFAKIVFLDTTTSRQLTFALRQNNIYIP